MRKQLLFGFVLLTSGVANAANWQYAVLNETSNGGLIWLPNDGSVVEASNYGGLIAKLNCAFNNTSLSSVLNCVGGQGWELIGTSQKLNATGALTTYTFKRSAP